MQEVKIQCDCGQRYKFDVEPVNGTMPFAVNCPICKLDGTAKANEVLRVGGGRQLSLPPIGVVAPAPIRIGGSGPAPVPAAPVVAAPAPISAPPAPVPARPAALRISGAPPAGSAPAAPPAIAAPVAAAPGRIGARPAGIGGPGAAAPEAVPGKKPSFALGLLGALIGTAVGSIIYFLVFYFSGWRISILAIGVGYLSGLGADLLSRKEGSKELGVIAAVLMLIGVVGAQYLVARSWWNEGMGERSGHSGYEAVVKEAKKVMAAMPNGTDDEIRKYLAKDASDEDEKVDPKAITDEEVKDFRDTTLKEMQDLAGGKITKEAYEAKLKAESEQEAKENKFFLSEEGTFKAIFLLLFLSKTNLISLVAGAGLAFKVCANA